MWITLWGVLLGNVSVIVQFEYWNAVPLLAMRIEGMLAISINCVYKPSDDLVAHINEL